MKRRSVIAALSGALLMGFGANAMADSTDDIVNALIAKGVLTEEEGALLMKGRAGEKEAAEEKKKSAVTAKIGNGGGIVFENGDKTASVSIGGRVQADYRAFNNGASNKTTNANLVKGNSSSSNEADTFDIRRARIEIKGQLFDTYSFLVSENLTGSNGNASASLDQAWLNIAWWKQAQFRFGQFKAPMNLEKMTSSNFIDFQERSVVNQLAPNEERGAMIWGTPMAGTTYGLSLTTGNGQNSNNRDTRVDGFEYTGRGTANFAEIMGSSDAVYHVGASASYVELPKSGNSPSSTGSTTNATQLLANTNSLRTESRGINFLTLPTFNNVVDVDNDIQRTRYGLEGVIAQGPVKFQTEWLRNQFKGDTSTTQSFNNNIDSWYVEALWLITGESYASAYKDGAFGNIKPKNDFEWGKGPGAWEVGARYSRLDAKDFGEFAKANGGTVGSVGTINLTTSTLEADTWTAGLKWILNANSRLMIDYSYTDFDTPIQISNNFVDNEKAITARGQWNF
jgi:phosphate-selective porin OprO/OprP